MDTRESTKSSQYGVIVRIYSSLNVDKHDALQSHAMFHTQSHIHDTHTITLFSSFKFTSLQTVNHIKFYDIFHVMLR